MSKDYAIWTKHRLSSDPMKTQAGLARALGLNKSAISRMLSGDRKITAGELDEIVAYLGVAHPGGAQERGFEDPDTEYVPAGLEPGIRRSSAPVYGTATRDDGHWSLDRSEPIDWRPKPWGHETSLRLFGFYAPDDAMTPRFKRGELIWVEPGRPAATGKDALLMRREEYEQLEHIILCEIIDLCSDKIFFRQHSRNGRTEVFHRDWTSHHVLGRL